MQRTIILIIIGWLAVVLSVRPGGRPCCRLRRSYWRPRVSPARRRVSARVVATAHGHGLAVICAFGSAIGHAGERNRERSR